jgi:predicted DNA-binding protein (UPF0278 family)
MADTNHAVVDAIMNVLKNEAIALQAWNDLANTAGLRKSDLSVIQNGIADESNHSINMLAMAISYNGGVMPSDDGLKQAISELD